jgi:hypothetical protein
MTMTIENEERKKWLIAIKRIWLKISIIISYSNCAVKGRQGILIQGEGSVQLTSSLRELVL